MDIQTKQAILDYINHIDPQHDVVQLTPNHDLSSGAIAFSSNMEQHRKETTLKGEKYAEAYLAVRLVKELRYPVSAFELQKTYPVGHRKEDRPRIDMIVHEIDGSSGKTRPFFFIEIKDPDYFDLERDYAIERQIYALADHERRQKLRYLVYYTVYYDGIRLVEKVDIIDFQLYDHFESWDVAGRTTLDLFPEDYGVARLSQYVNKDKTALLSGERQLRTTGSPREFSGIRRNLQDRLWAGGGMSYNEILAFIYVLDPA